MVGERPGWVWVGGGLGVGECDHTVSFLYVKEFYTEARQVLPYRLFLEQKCTTHSIPVPVHYNGGTEGCRNNVHSWLVIKKYYGVSEQYLAFG